MEIIKPSHSEGGNSDKLAVIPPPALEKRPPPIDPELLALMERTVSAFEAIRHTETKAGYPGTLRNFFGTSAQPHSREELFDGLRGEIESAFQRAVDYASCLKQLEARRAEVEKIVIRACRDDNAKEEWYSALSMLVQAHTIRSFIADESMAPKEKMKALFSHFENLHPAPWDDDDYLNKDMTTFMASMGGVALHEGHTNRFIDWKTLIDEWGNPSADRNKAAEQAFAEMDRKLAMLEEKLLSRPPSEALKRITEEEGTFISSMATWYPVFIKHEDVFERMYDITNKRSDEVAAWHHLPPDVLFHFANAEELEYSLPWGHEKMGFGLSESPESVLRKVMEDANAIPSYCDGYSSGCALGRSPNLHMYDEVNAALPGWIEKILPEMEAKYLPEVLSAQTLPTPKSHVAKETARRGLPERSPDSLPFP